MEFLMVLIVGAILTVTNASIMNNIRQKRQTYGNANTYAAYDPALYDPNNVAGVYQQQYGAQQSYSAQPSRGYAQQPSYSAGNQAYGQQAAGYPQQAYVNQQPAYSGNQQAGYAAYGYGR